MGQTSLFGDGSGSHNLNSYSSTAAVPLGPQGAGWATHTGPSGVPCCRQLVSRCSSFREAVEPTREVPSGMEDLPQGAAASLAPHRGPPPAPPPCLTVHAAYGMRQGFFPLHRELVNPFFGTIVMTILLSKESWCLCFHCYCPKTSCNMQGTHPLCPHLTISASANPARFCSKNTPYKEEIDLSESPLLVLQDKHPSQADSIRLVLQSYSNLPCNPQLRKGYRHRKWVGSGFHQCLKKWLLKSANWNITSN